MYKRLSNEELNDFTSRVVVQLDPSLTQQVMSLILELSEYRAKIENGTLIDTKVRKGQRVYMKGFFDNEVEEYIVSDITLENGELEVHLKHDYDEGKTCYSCTVLGIGEIGRKVFLTKPEIEKKSRELKENSND